VLVFDTSLAAAANTVDIATACGANDATGTMNRRLVRRSHPMLVPLGAALGPTEEQIDAAFVQAARL
jgi:hypothetical protein